MSLQKPEETFREFKHLADESFRLLVDGVKDYAIFLLDPDGFICSWNEGACRAKLYTAGEAIGQHFSIFYTADDRARKKPWNLLQIAMTDGRVEDEGWRVRKDGTHFWADVILTALYDDKGVHRGFAKVTRDMTEQRKLITSLEEAVAASQAKSAFLANMSHELRTPLTAILGYAELLSEQLQENNLPDLVEDVDKIQYSGKHLLSIISDILDLSKIEAGRFELIFDEVSLKELVSNVAEAIMPIARCKGTSMQISIAEEVPEFIRADATRLRQVLYNLLANAAKFTINGTITVDVSCEQSARYVKIAVCDTGIGMTPVEVASIFDRFYRVESVARQINKGGTGLGLAISKMICEAMGGGIGVSSEKGVGSTFTVTLPCE